MRYGFQVDEADGQANLPDLPGAGRGYNRSMPPRSDPYARESAGARWALVAAVLAGAALFALLGSGAATRLLGRGSPAAVRSERRQAPALQAYAEPAEALRDTQRTMPADVRAWLEHLERVERKRQELATDQVAAALVSLATVQGLGGAGAMLKDLLGDPEAPPEPEAPSTKVGRDSAEWAADWGALLAEFRRLPPPPACVPVRNAYSRALDGTAEMISEVGAQIERSAQDPQAAVAALGRLRGTSASRIDAAAKEADRAVGELCQDYDTPRWFSIAPDVGGGALGRIGGL